MKLNQLPLMIFFALAILLAIGLTLNPREVPSALINQPAANLKGIQTLEQTQFDPSQLQGKVWLLNVWASWCQSCAYEHQQLHQIQSETSALLIGLNYKDEQAPAIQWLQQKGNPYHSVLFDPEGQVAMDWGGQCHTGNFCGGCQRHHPP